MSMEPTTAIGTSRLGLRTSPASWAACSKPSRAKTMPSGIAMNTPLTPYGMKPPPAVKLEGWKDLDMMKMMVMTGTRIFQVQRLQGEDHLGIRVTGGEPVAHPAGLIAQAGLVHDVGGRAEAFGEVADSDAADGQFPVWRDGTVLGKERKQVAVRGAGRVRCHVSANDHDSPFSSHSGLIAWRLPCRRSDWNTLTVDIERSGIVTRRSGGKRGQISPGLCAEPELLLGGQPVRRRWHSAPRPA